MSRAAPRASGASRKIVTSPIAATNGTMRVRPATADEQNASTSAESSRLHPRTDGQVVEISDEAVVAARAHANSSSRLPVRTAVNAPRGAALCMREYAADLCGRTPQWAEGEGFEPPDAFASLAFKASAIGRSANPPGAAILPYAPPHPATC